MYEDVQGGHIVSQVHSDIPKDVKTLIAHGDADGLCSAAIALRRFPNAKVVFAEPTNINDLVNTVEKPAIVLDVASAKPMTGLFIIDHHPAEKTGFKSNTEMMRDWPESSEYLIQLGQVGDSVPIQVPKYVREDSDILYAVLGAISDVRDADRLRLLIVKELAKGKRIQEITEVMEIYSEKKEEINKIISAAIEYAEKNAEFYKNALIITYPDAPQGYVGHIANSMKNRAFTIILIWSPQVGKTVVTIRARTRNGLEIIDKIKSIDKNFISGGGHSHACSYSTSSSIDEVKRQIKEVL